MREEGATMHNQFNYIAMQRAWEQENPSVALRRAVCRVCDDADSYRPIGSGGACAQQSVNSNSCAPYCKVG